MNNLFPRNIIQTATQLQDEQNRLLEEAKVKADELKREKKATFTSTFAKKVSSESVIGGNSMTSVDPTTIPNAGKSETSTQDSDPTATIDTSMPLVEALRRHFEQN